jgi:hypothetical protein
MATDAGGAPPGPNVYLVITRTKRVLNRTVVYLSVRSPNVFVFAHPMPNSKSVRRLWSAFELCELPHD